MSNRNTVEQVVKLDNKDYKKGNREVRSEAEKTSKKVSEEAKKASENHRKSTDEHVRNNNRISHSIKDVAKRFKDASLGNLYKGGVIAATAGYAATVKNSFDQAKKSVLDLDKIMARMGSRFSLSSDKIKKFREEFTKLGKQTGVNAGEVGAAGEILYKTRKDTQGLGSIAKAASMSDDMQADDIARTVVDYLKSSGKDVNGKTINDFLTSASAMTRGGDMKLSEAINSLSSQGQVKAKLGLSERENAALIAASTNVGQDRNASVAGLNAVLSKSAEGFFADSGLAAMLGVQGGFKTDGKFDLGKLKQASEGMNKQGFQKADFISLLQGSGLGKDEAEGLYSILSEFDKFESSFKEVVKDNKSLNQAFSEETNNLGDNFKKFNEGLAKAADDVLSPLSKVANDLLSGNFGSALANAPEALADSAKGAINNPKELAIGAGALIAGGVLGKKLGLFGEAKSVAQSKFFSQTFGEKVTFVHVVNASDIAKAMDEPTQSTGGLFKNIKLDKIFGKGNVLSGTVNKLSGASKLLARTGLVGAAGAVGYGVGTLANMGIDKYTQNTTEDGAFQGNVVERLIYKLDSFFGGEGAKALQQAANVNLKVIDPSGRFTFEMEPSMDKLTRNVE